MKKKIFASIQIIVMLVTLFAPLNVLAAAGKIILSSDTQELSLGSTVKITLEAHQIEDLFGLQFQMNYDKEYLQYQSYTLSDEYSSFDAVQVDTEAGTIFSPLIRKNIENKNKQDSFEMASFVFTVKKEGKTNISVSKVKAISSETFINEFGKKDMKILSIPEIQPITLQGKIEKETDSTTTTDFSLDMKKELEKAEKLLEEDVQKAAEALLGILNKATGTLSKGEQEEIRKVATEVIQQLQSIPPKIITEEGKAIAKVDAAFLTKNMEIATKLLEKVKAKGITVPETNILTVAMKEEKSSEIQFQKEVLTFMDQHNNHVQVQFPNIKVTFAPNAIEYDDTDQILLQMTPMKKGEIKTNNITYTDYNTYDIDMVRVIGKQRSKINQFNKKVELQIHYQASPLEEEKLGLYYYNEEKQSWEYIKQGKQDKQNKYFTVSLEQLGSYGIFHYAKDYVDLDQTYTEARYAIEVLTAKHMIKGVDDSHYAPNQSVTRAEFATLLVNAMDFSLKQYQGVFQDVQGTAWYAPYVQTAYEAGLIQGQGEGKYNPQGKITREEMAVMIARAYEYKGKEATLATDGFTDEGEISSWAKEAARKMKAEGLIKGVGNNNFAPKKDTLRSDAAVMMYRLINGFEVQ